jgi:hypothetical protein
VATDGGTSRPVEVSVGIIADPGLTREVADDIAAGLPDELSRRLGDGRLWRVTTQSRRLAADEQGVVRLAELARGGAPKEFDLLVYLTDQPRRDGVRAIVADVSLADGIALASLPAFGAFRLRPRALEAVAQLITELVAREVDSRDSALGPFRRIVPDDEHIDVRFIGSGLRSRLRVLAGMVWANRPWRLITGLSGAAAAATATAVYVLITPSVWKLADALGPLRLTGAAVLAVVAMVAWLIIDHEMWERPATPAARELATLYNATTLVTVAVGVLFVYAGLFVLAGIAEAVVVDGGLVREAIGHPDTLGTYLVIAWTACSFGTVAGALGTGFQSDEAVHQAAYGFRQRERTRRQQEEKERAEYEGDGGSGSLDV